jgi:hypothetical protein
MSSIKLSRAHPEVKAIIRATFPAYRGRRINFSPDIPSYELDSYWFEGSRDYWAFYQPSTKKTWHLAGNHPWYERHNPRPVCDAMPQDVCLVRHTICCGQDCGITIYARAPIGIAYQPVRKG